MKSRPMPDEKGFVEVIAAIIILAISIAASPALIEVTKYVSSEVANANQPSNAYVSVSNGVVKATNPILAINLDRIKLTVNGQPVAIEDANHNGVWEPFETITFDLNPVLGKDVVVITLYIDGKEVYRTVYVKPTAFSGDSDYPVISINNVDARNNLALDLSVSDDTAVVLQKVVIGNANAVEQEYKHKDVLGEVAKRHRKKVEDLVREIKEGNAPEDVKDFHNQVSIKKDLSSASYIRIVAKDISGKTSSKIVWLRELRPLVSIIKPSSGQVFWNSSDVSILARASNASKVYLYVDGSKILSKNAGSSPYEFGKTVKLPAGTHTITARAENAAGAAESSVTITVKPDNAPLVKINQPKDKDVVTSTTVKATAQDDRGLTAVRLYFNGALLKEYSASGKSYSLSYPFTPSKEGEIKVVAVDNSGKSGEDSVYIYRDLPPAVAVSAPPSVYAAGTSANVRITASAKDDYGVDHVEFFVDGAKYTDSAEPYEVVKSLTIGSHTIKAVAVDKAGQKAEDSTTVTVRRDNPPAVQITQPGNGQTFWTTKNYYTLTIKASASDDRGIKEVRFYDNGRYAGRDTNAPYQIAANLGIGSHTIKAVAVDTAGQKAEDSVTISVIRDNPPAVQITSPTNGQTFWSTGNSYTLTVKATASDDRGIKEVRFYVDGIYSGSDNRAPYTDLEILDVGTHTIKAVAVDTAGQKAEDSVTINVIRDNPPTVQITSPTNGQKFWTTKNYYTLTIKASASDDLGIKEVRFYVDSRYTGADTSPPYQIAASLGIGSHTIKAVAVDTAGQTAEDTVTVTVVQPPKIIGASVPVIGWSTNFNGGTPVIGGVS